MTDKGCVVCGKEAGWGVADGDHEWPVCDDHLLPGYQIKLMLAEQAVRAAWQMILADFAAVVARLLRCVGVVIE